MKPKPAHHEHAIERIAEIDAVERAGMGITLVERAAEMRGDRACGEDADDGQARQQHDGEGAKQKSDILFRHGFQARFRLRQWTMKAIAAATAQIAKSTPPAGSDR